MCSGGRGVCGGGIGCCQDTFIQEGEGEERKINRALNYIGPKMTGVHQRAWTGVHTQTTKLTASLQGGRVKGQFGKHTVGEIESRIRDVRLWPVSLELVARCGGACKGKATENVFLCFATYQLCRMIERSRTAQILLEAKVRDQHPL